MSLVTTLRDLADLLNEIYSAKEVSGDVSTLMVLQAGLIYTGKALGSLVIYLFTFQWLRDLSYLPLLAPSINPVSFFGDQIVEDSTSHLFSFSSVSNQATDQLVAGLINSFFFSLPFSLPHLVSLKRLYSQGIAAAAASVMGIIAAHTLFLIGVVYGLRFLIIPWFSLEPLSYVIGVLTIGVIINGMAQDKGIKVIRLRSKNELLRMCGLNFLLTWCEEMTLFHSLNNLTLNAQTTYLDLYPSNTAFHSFVIHTTYLLAFFLGNCVFSILFYYLLLRGQEYLCSWIGFSFARMTRILNKLMLFLILGFTLSSFPYYGLDYLFTNIAGFLPEDPAYTNTVFSPTMIKTKYPHFFKEIPPVSKKEKTPINLDLNYFDRGLYLNAPKEESNPEVVLQKEKDRKKGITPTEIPVLSFEELNYQGEYAWVLRNDSAKERSQNDKNLFSHIFKKSRQNYMSLREKSQNRLVEKARRAREKIVPGHLPERKEGLLPDESTSLFMKVGDFLDRTFILPRKVKEEMRLFITPDAKNLLLPSQAEIDIDSNQERSAPIKMIEIAPRVKNENTDPLQEEIDFQHDIKLSFSKGFMPPFSHETTQTPLLPIKNAFKKKYFFNPVYRTLLQTDIDLFLARQPAAYKIAENQEYHLYEKRQLLEKYYNWLRYYQPFDKMIQLKYEIPDCKSFVDRVYHQQFKGTLRVASRLFKVTFDSEQNPQKRRVLSYDQMLYKDLQANENPFIHEELYTQDLIENTPSDQIQAKQYHSSQEEPFISNKTELNTQENHDHTDSTTDDDTDDEINYQINEKTGDNTDYDTDDEIDDDTDDETDDEEPVRDPTITDLSIFESPKKFDPEDSPFIEKSNSSPIYAGWDETLRRFVITNRFAVIEDPNQEELQNLTKFNTEADLFTDSDSEDESENFTENANRKFHRNKSRNFSRNFSADESRDERGDFTGDESGDENGDFS